MLKGLIKLTRIGEYYGSSLVLTGVGLIANRGVGYLDRLELLLAIIFINVFAFAINDVEDADDDAKDPKKVNRNPLSAGLIGRGFALIFTLISGILPLVILAKFGWWSFIFGAMAIFLGFAYSYKKIRLKSVPVLDIVSHGLFLGALQIFVVISAGNQPISTLGFSLALLVFIGSAMGDINNEIRDHEVDRATGIRNTASILNLTHIGKFMHFLAIFPYGLLALIYLYNTTVIIRWFSFIYGAILFSFYMFYYGRKMKRGFYDRYNQAITAIFGLGLLLLH